MDDYTAEKDPYRRLQIVDEHFGPTLCIECIHSRCSNEDEWRHITLIENDSYRKIQLKYTDTWRCVADPSETGINYINGMLDYTNAPRCANKNNGSCQLFKSIKTQQQLPQTELSFEEEFLLSPPKKKPWWKFW